MSDVIEVSPHDTDADATHWTVRGPAGKQLSWQARIVEDVPGEKVAWTTVDSSNPAVPNFGVVRFDDKGDGSTGVKLSLIYDTPGGAVGEAAATLFDNPQRKVENAVDACTAAATSGTASLGSPRPDTATTSNTPGGVPLRP